jgi:hypothetical protein
MKAQSLKAKVISALSILALLAPAISGHSNAASLEKDIWFKVLDCCVAGDGVKLNARIIQEEIGPRHANAGG